MIPIEIEKVSHSSKIVSNHDQWQMNAYEKACLSEMQEIFVFDLIFFSIDPNSYVVKLLLLLERYEVRTEK